MDLSNIIWNLSICSAMIRKSNEYCETEMYYWLIWEDLEDGNQIQIRQENESETRKASKNNFMRFRRKWKLKYKSE
jgi:hypothetical protein